MKQFNIPEFSVSEFSRNIKRLVEDAFGYVRIRGEVSGFKKATSGHLYFSLKDEKSLIYAVCFANAAKAIDFEIKDGLEIIVSGYVSTYEARSNYQINVEKAEIAGIGLLLEEIENRRTKLLSEGLFDEKYKKKLPFFPKKIAVITSPTGAVIEDIKHRISARFPTNLLVYSALMQGKNCALEVISGIRYFNNLSENKQPDLIIIARGGGSFEDLLPFNDEELIRAVFTSKIPIISAIGHETDTTLIDYVSDIRASTPTAAAEMATPILSNLKQTIDFLEQKLNSVIGKNLQQQTLLLENLGKYLISPKQVISRVCERFLMISQQMNFFVRSTIEKKQQKVITKIISKQWLRSRVESHEKDFLFLIKNLQLKSQQSLLNLDNSLQNLTNLLKNCDYKQTLKRGFSLIKNKDNNLIASLENIKNGEIIAVEVSDGKFSALVIEERLKKSVKKSVETDNNQYQLI